jgi:hypothetical protein
MNIKENNRIFEQYASILRNIYNINNCRGYICNYINYINGIYFWNKLSIYRIYTINEHINNIANGYSYVYYTTKINSPFET